MPELLLCLEGLKLTLFSNVASAKHALTDICQVSQNKGKLYTIDVTFILVTLHLIIIVTFFEHLMLAVQVQ